MTRITGEWQDAPQHAVKMLLEAGEKVRDISDEPVIPSTSTDPPIPLSPDQQRVWDGDVQSSDRSGGLVEITRLLSDNGYINVEGIASIIAERDITLGWHKYSGRHDAGLRYREIATRYGRPAPRINLSGTVGPGRSVPLRGGTGRTDRRDKTQPPPGVEDELPVHTVREERERPEEVVVWLIEGWLGKGMMTEVVGKVKMGKTTFAMRGLQAGVDGEESYCGQTITRPFRVLYITEEGRATFHEALQRYGLWDLEDEFCMVYDFEIIGMDLDVAVGKMIRAAEKYQVDVVVIDTLTTVAGLDDEDNSGRVGAAMREFRRIANAGYAVWVLRHGRKAGGEVGDAGRGSSAISGAVDILLQIDPYRGDDDESNLRVLRAKGRMKATPTAALTLKFDKESERYVLVGETVSKEERLSLRVLTALSDLEAYDEASGVTAPVIAKKIGKRPQPVRDEVKRLVEDGEVLDGKRPTPGGGTPQKIYWLPPRAHITIGGHGPSVPSDEPESTVETQPPPGVDSEPTVGRSVPLPEGDRDGPTVEVPKPRKQKTPEQQAKLDAERAARELARLEAADAAAPTLDYQYVASNQALVDILTKLDTSCLSLDTETTGLSAQRDRLRTIQFSDGRTHVVADGWSITDWSPLQSALRSADTVRMHTYLFDLAFLQTVGVEVKPEKIQDVRTAAMVLESTEDWTDYRLQGIAKRHLKQHVDKAEQKRGWDVVHLRHAKLAYAAEDARVTWAAGEALMAKYADDPDLDSLNACLDLEQSVQAATWWLASAGAPCDAVVMHQAILEQEASMAERLEHLNQVAGTSAGAVNWRSPSQVLPILLDRGLDIAGTSEDALMDAESDDEIIDALLSYRSAGACLGLLRKAQSSIAPDGRIYASFNPIGAQTGRTSCSDPNLQNLPHDTLARAAIRPGLGRVFVRADYSQLQIVIAAKLADDRTMIDILNTGTGDIHTATAQAMGITRKQAKAVNFGFLFGAGAETFRREQRKNGVILTEREAQRLRDMFMRTYRGIRSWHRGLSDWGVEEVIFDPSGSGRRRRAVFSRNVKANTPVQMVEAHGFKLALKALYETRTDVPSARLVMMVHDELIAECDLSEAVAVAEWLKLHMTNAMQPLVDGVQVLVEPTIVNDYSDQENDRVKHERK